VDGHVLARLPKHYVSQQRLCLRATTDYWVNAMDGQLFFVVHRPVDPGLLQVLEQEIIPRLEQEAPNQPTDEELAADPQLDKFIVVHELKAERGAVAHHPPLGQVPEAERFDRLSSGYDKAGGLPGRDGDGADSIMKVRNLGTTQIPWAREV
jgi:hypothetical protein